jgi:hypothetical protein
MGEKSYTNVCANMDVWLDGDFISAFTSLVCQNNHSLIPTALMESGQNVPQLTHVTFPNSHMIINDYKALPSSIKCCRKPPRYVPYKCTYVPYDGTFCASDQGQTLDV